MIRSGELTQVRRGIYIREEGVSGRVLANVICGPSYLSFEYALSFHGLIQLWAFSNMFPYLKPYIPTAFSISLITRHISLIASPEKALCDTLLKNKPVEAISPPAGGTHEVKYQLNPIPHHVSLYSLPTLFAGKIHAILARDWETRVKGRNFFDYLWYLSNNTGVDMAHLRNRLVQSGHLNAEENWNISILIQRLVSRFSAIDFTAAAKDVMPFIKDPSVLNLWSEHFFSSVTNDKLKEYTLIINKFWTESP